MYRDMYRLHHEGEVATVIHWSEGMQITVETDSKSDVPWQKHSRFEDKTLSSP